MSIHESVQISRARKGIIYFQQGAFGNAEHKEVSYGVRIDTNEPDSESPSDYLWLNGNVVYDETVPTYRGWTVEITDHDHGYTYYNFRVSKWDLEYARLAFQAFFWAPMEVAK